MANRLGYAPVITQMYRSRAEQQRLYDGWIRRLPGFNPAYHPDDPRARHTKGMAIDWGSLIGHRGTTAQKVAHATAATHGWSFNVPEELWHAEKVRPSFSDVATPGPITPIKKVKTMDSIPVILDLPAAKGDPLYGSTGILYPLSAAFVVTSRAGQSRDAFNARQAVSKRSGGSVAEAVHVDRGGWEQYVLFSA